MKIIRADQRHFQNFGWLETFWLFSFDSYRDPGNMHHGRLRVFNDDVVHPDQGFDMHPHRDMEIVSIILEGEISHKDSMGNEMTIGAGEAQRMSAGSGIMHSEHNRGDVPLRIWQIWLFPREKGATPSYEQVNWADKIENNSLTKIVAGTPGEALLSIDCDATISIGQLDSGKSVTHESNEGNSVFIYVESGSIIVDGERLESRDQARIVSSGKILIESTESSQFILIDTK